MYILQLKNTIQACYYFESYHLKEIWNRLDMTREERRNRKIEIKSIKVFRNFDYDIITILKNTSIT
jgi:hypothetical protein